MATDFLESNWSQLREAVRRQWGRLTDEDLDTIAGRRDRLVQLLQERYRWSPQRAESEVAWRLPTFVLARTAER